MSDPTYDSQTQEIFNSKLGRVALKSNLRRMVIVCDNALNEAPFRVRGDMVWFDQNTSAAGAMMKLNNTSEDPLPVAPLGGVLDYPITDVFVTCAAQPGKVINLWYGYRARFISPVSLTDISDRAGRLLGIVSGSLGSLAQQAIGGVNSLLVSPRGIAYGVAYKNNAVIGVANTSTQILAPASNVAGVIVWGGGGWSRSTGVTFGHFVAHTASPVAFGTGDALGEFTMHEDGTSGADIFHQCRIDQPTLVPAGKGLYWFSAAVEVFAAQSLRYTIL